MCTQTVCIENYSPCSRNSCVLPASFRFRKIIIIEYVLVVHSRHKLLRTFQNHAYEKFKIRRMYLHIEQGDMYLALRTQWMQQRKKIAPDQFVHRLKINEGNWFSKKKKKCSTHQPFRAVDKQITILVFNFRDYFIFLLSFFFPFHRLRISIIWFEWWVL